MKTFCNEDGQTLVFTALSMTMLLGIMGLAIDTSLLFRAQRKVQTAADAAAIAAGLEYFYNGTVTTSSCGTGTGNVACAAYTAASHNGVTNNNQVTVNIGPTSGWHTGSSYVEVVIKQPNPTFFMAAFGQLFGSRSFSSVNVGGRAVAGIVPGQACMYALDSSAADAVDVQGAAVITAPHCAIQINSNNSTALCSTGSATINSSGIRIVGAQNPSGKCNKSQANAQTGVNTVPNPLASLPNPTCNAGNTFSVGGSNPQITSGTQLKNKAGTTVSFTPVTETSGSGANTTTASVVCFSDSNLTIPDGVILGTVSGNSIFVFQNGVTLGSDTINGTVDVAGGNFSQGNSSLVVKAPANTSYTYNGIGLMVPATNTSVTCGGSYNSFKGTPAPGGCLQIQFGSGSANLDGMIYAPAAAVYMQDNGGATVVTTIIADEIYDKASSLTLTDNYNYAHSTSPLNQVSLVE